MTDVEEELGIPKKKFNLKINDGVMIAIIVVLFIIIMVMYKPVLNLMLKDNYEKYFAETCRNSGTENQFTRNIVGNIIGNNSGEDPRVKICADGGGCFKSCKDRCEKWQKIESTFDYFFGIEKQKCDDNLGLKCIPVCICPYGQIITGNLTTKDWRCVDG